MVHATVLSLLRVCMWVWVWVGVPYTQACERCCDEHLYGCMCYVVLCVLHVCVCVCYTQACERCCDKLDPGVSEPWTPGMGSTHTHTRTHTHTHKQTQTRIHTASSTHLCPFNRFSTCTRDCKYVIPVQPPAHGCVCVCLYFFLCCSPVWTRM